MKNGNASVVLKNVTVNDSGTYQCRVITSQTSSKRDADGELVSSVNLTVSERPEHPGGPGGRVGLGVGVGLFVVGLVLVVAGLVVKSKRAKEKRPLESVDVKLNP
ncbi:hypothetical protein CesoFtcFv8_026499 [Champsocephalus esox]|uniref:Immunoglobulin V-set domain-containing protein n=1 Tax=Champsocephalus esox TaxID=159716 RepID=A0AAN8GB85_9TELE|nr:hypothetical protein CesoFtcFv8_026499 [Champsocephalus esox]